MIIYTHRYIILYLGLHIHSFKKKLILLSKEFHGLSVKKTLRKIFFHTNLFTANIFHIMEMCIFKGEGIRENEKTTVRKNFVLLQPYLIFPFIIHYKTIKNA